VICFLIKKLHMATIQGDSQQVRFQKLLKEVANLQLTDVTLKWYDYHRPYEAKHEKNI
jgi:hypothetical protein